MQARTGGASWVTVALLCILPLALAACAGSADPENLEVLKRELRHYHDSGAYEREQAAVTAEAEARLVDAAATGQGKLAIVLDIDDTSLSGWPKFIANDFGFIKRGPCDLPDGPCGHDAWFMLAEAPAIEPTGALFETAQSLGYAVIFISGRPESVREATARNLRWAGYDSWTKLILRPGDRHFKSMADFKAPVRRAIVGEGYRIVVNMGDQKSDLAGGYADHAFKLPNPFYIVP